AGSWLPCGAHRYNLTRSRTIHPFLREPSGTAMPSTIRSPDDPALAELTAELAKRSAELDTPGAWPADQLVLCGEYGVYEWFLEPSFGGQAWSPADICRGYLAL